MIIMKKGQNKRVWTPEEKAEIVYKHLNDHISLRSLEKEYHTDRGMICKWVKKYIAEGESSFVHKGHPGNPFAALHVSKNLSEVERLRLTVAKLEVENERLKKGYLAKGVGASKEFVTGRGKSSRSLTRSDPDIP